MSETRPAAVVTGAGRGIGKGCALELARVGMNVVVNDRPGGKDLAATAEEVRSFGVECFPIEADIFSRSGCEQLVEQAIGAAGKIDVLVSNPAFGVRCDFLNYDPDDFERAMLAVLCECVALARSEKRSCAVAEAIAEDLLTP